MHRLGARLSVFSGSQASKVKQHIKNLLPSPRFPGFFSFYAFTSPSMAGCRAHTELEAEKLTCEIVELENSVVHLKRSNQELADALASSPDDTDFQDALNENTAVIKKKENLLEELKKELRAHKSMLVTALGAAEARQLPAAIAIENEAAAAAAAAADTQAAAAVAAAARAAQASAASNQATPDQQQQEEEEEKEGGVYL